MSSPSPIGLYGTADDIQDTNDEIDQLAQTQTGYEDFAQQANQHALDIGAQYAQFQQMAGDHAASIGDQYQQFQDAVANHVDSGNATIGSSEPATGGTGDVPSAIDAQTNDPRVRMAMKLGASLEGGLSGPFAAGDSGGSFGPYQINHNQGMHQDITRADSEDPLVATKYMLGAYQDAVEKVPPEMWSQDPKQAARLAAFYAERPAVIYDQNRVDNAWQALQAAPAATDNQATDRQAPGTFGELDPSAAIAATGNDLESHPDTSEHEPAANEGIAPVAQYNQEAPGGLGAFQQVTRNASGNYDVQPAAQPTPEQQAAYEANQAATSGFSSPEVGVPLLASGQTATVAAPNSQVQATPPAPSDITDVSGVNLESQPPQIAGAEAPQPPVGPIDVKSMLADALHQVADTLGGGAQNAMSAVTGFQPNAPIDQQNPTAAPPGTIASQISPENPLLNPDLKTAGGINAFSQELGQQAGAAVTGGSKPVVTGVLQQVLNPEFAPGSPPGELAGQAINKMVGLAAKPIAEAIGPRIGDLVSSITGPAAKAIGEAPGMVIDTAGAPAADAVVAPAAAVSNAASDLANALPAMGGGATSGARPVITALNKLIGTMQDGIKAAPGPQEALNATSMADPATLSLAKGLEDEYAKFKLAPEDSQHVADILEGVPATTTGTVSQLAVDAADAFKATTDAVKSMATDTGVLNQTIENYFTHMVRMPKNEGTPLGNATKLSAFSQFAMNRARDADGNMLWPTLRDFQEYVTANHPDWQVVTDVPTLVANQVRSLVTASNHAALADKLLGATRADGKPLLSAIKQAGDQQLTNLPQSLSRWLYRGATPEEGPVLVGGRGVVGGAPDGQAVVSKMPAQFTTPEAKQMIDRYVASDLISPTAGGPVLQKIGQIYDKINGNIVGNKLLNIFIHSENGLSELDQYLDPRQVPGFAADRAAMQKIMADPVARTEFLQKVPLNLPQMQSYARSLAQRTGALPEEGSGVMNALGQVKAGTIDKVASANHELLFNQYIQRLQIQSAIRAMRSGMDPEAAGAYANAKMGQFAPQDLNAATRWINAHLLFAGKWFTGGMLQYQSLLGKTGYGGYAENLSPASQKALAAALRGDFLKGTGALVGAHIIANKLLGGVYPWQNADGRWLDVNINNVRPGSYLSDPLFKRQQDLLKFVISPFDRSAGQPTISQRFVQAPAEVILNKAAPVLGLARNQIANEQMPFGKPIMTAKEDTYQQLKDELGFLAAQYLPGGEHINAALNPKVQVTDSGPAGTLLNVRSLDTPGQKAGGGPISISIGRHGATVRHAR